MSDTMMVASATATKPDAVVAMMRAAHGTHASAASGVPPSAGRGALPLFASTRTRSHAHGTHHGDCASTGTPVASIDRATPANDSSTPYDSAAVSVPFVATNASAGSTQSTATPCCAGTTSIRAA